MYYLEKCSLVAKIFGKLSKHPEPSEMHLKTALRFHLSDMKVGVVGSPHALLMGACVRTNMDVRELSVETKTSLCSS